LELMGSFSVCLCGSVKQKIVKHTHPERNNTLTRERNNTLTRGEITHSPREEITHSPGGERHSLGEK